MYNPNPGQQMQNNNQSNPNMNPKFMMPAQNPQNFMNFPQGMNRVGMVPKPELPLHLQVLFAPRMPLVYVKPPEKHKCRSFDPIIRPNFDFLSKFEDEEPPEKIFYESIYEKKMKMEKEKNEEFKNKLKEALKQWNPQEDPKCTGDPMKTLFIARISFETSEKKLRKEFEVYGPLKKIRLIKNITNNKARGYAFIEFEHKKDFINAYKQADGKKIDERRVLVDCERGRCVKGWKPRRFGGGKGETRRARSSNKEKAGNDKKKSSISRSKDNNNKKRRSRTLSKNRSRSRERSRERRRGDFNPQIRDRPERERDNNRERIRDRTDRDNKRDNRDRRFDNDREKKDRENKDRERKERERDIEKRNNKNEKEIKKEKKEKENLFKMEDEGEVMPVEIEKKKKKKKGKERERSRDKKRSKSPKEKKQKKSRDKKLEREIKNKKDSAGFNGSDEKKEKEQGLIEQD